MVEESVFNPWRYASKRFDIETNLINFGKRYYDADLSRWITADPAGFIDGMNLYGYVKNNPYRYTDPNGLFAIALFIPVIEITFSAIVSWVTVEAVIGAVVGTAMSVGLYQLDKTFNNDDHDISLNNEAVIGEVEAETKKKKKGKDNEIKGGPPREHATGNYLPDSAAEGNPHTHLGTRDGRKGPYT